MEAGRARIECSPKRDHDPAFAPFVQELRAGTAYLLGSGPTTDDPLVECVEIGTFGQPEGLSRNHLTLLVSAGAVEARDHSRFGTFRRYGRLADPVTLTRPETLSLAGVVRVLIEPPMDDASAVEVTHQPGTQVITGPVRRHVVAALLADHIIPPDSRGAYLLTDEEIAVLFRISPDTVKEHLQKARAQIRDDVGDVADAPRSREELIDWVKSWSEVTEADVAMMDAYLTSTAGRGYEAGMRDVSARRRTRNRRDS